MTMLADPTAAPLDASWRARLPAAAQGGYLNIRSRGMISNTAKAAAERMIEGHWLADMPKVERMPTPTGAREKFVRLIGAQGPHEVAVLENVSESVNPVATALDWRPGGNVVLTTEVEHGDNIYAWLLLREKGVEVRQAPHVDGHIDPRRMAEAVDDRTRLVTAASVTLTPGCRTDLAALGRAARTRGALFIVDAAQSLGVLTLDVEDVGADAVATSTSKGLLGLMGLGFLYVRESWPDRLRPAFVARHSVRTLGHESEFEGDEFAYADDATRFEIGNCNWTGIAVADVALAELLEAGPARIEAHSLALAQALRAGPAAQRLRVAMTDAARCSHLVTVGGMGTGDTCETNDPRLNRIARALEADGVRFSIRRGMLRFGFHLYNDSSDVERALDVARAA